MTGVEAWGSAGTAIESFSRYSVAAKEDGREDYLLGSREQESRSKPPDLDPQKDEGISSYGISVVELSL